MAGTLGTFGEAEAPGEVLGAGEVVSLGEALGFGEVVSLGEALGAVEVVPPGELLVPGVDDVTAAPESVVAGAGEAAFTILIPLRFSIIGNTKTRATATAAIFFALLFIVFLLFYIVSLLQIEYHIGLLLSPVLSKIEWEKGLTILSFFPCRGYNAL